MSGLYYSYYYLTLRLEMSNGIRVLQVYLRCLDLIVHSQHYLDPTTHSIDVSSVLESQPELNHKHSCDKLNCSVLHLRDDNGDFYSLDSFL